MRFLQPLTETNLLKNITPLSAVYCGRLQSYTSNTTNLMRVYAAMVAPTLTSSLRTQPSKARRSRSSPTKNWQRCKYINGFRYIAY